MSFLYLASRNALRSSIMKADLCCCGSLQDLIDAPHQSGREVDTIKQH